MTPCKCPHCGKPIGDVASPTYVAQGKGVLLEGLYPFLRDNPGAVVRLKDVAAAHDREPGAVFACINGPVKTKVLEKTRTVDGFIAVKAGTHFRRGLVTMANKGARPAPVITDVKITVTTGKSKAFKKPAVGDVRFTKKHGIEIRVQDMATNNGVPIGRVVSGGRPCLSWCKPEYLRDWDKWLVNRAGTKDAIDALKKEHGL